VAGWQSVRAGARRGGGAHGRQSGDVAGRAAEWRRSGEGSGVAVQRGGRRSEID
jgi:hypothetical protein